MSNHHAVVVNLAVEIDASGTIEVFGQEVQEVKNVVVAAVPLPVTDLYVDTNSSMFEFWEPEGELGVMKATLSGKVDAAYPDPVSGRNYTNLTQDLATDLNTVLVGDLDASGAKPFDTYKAGGVSQYYVHESFGRLALSSYAHYLFGHVAATAAITNDATFIEKMNGVGEGNADIAQKIVDAITGKNDAAILEIVKQVIGQDASRAMGQDNNQLAPGVRHALKFIEGDKIYVNVRLRAPEVTVSGGIGGAGAQMGEPAASAFGDATQLANSDQSIHSYTIEITLGA
jgi:hypothetical protein